MAEETITQPISTPEAPKEPSRAEERITQLSEKVRIEAEAKAQAEQKAKEAEQRASFAEGFADVLSSQPAAKDHKDEIKAKVMAGYSVEDATYAVLGKAGKLGGNIESAAPQVAGGPSAVNTPQTGAKSPSEMTQAERREELAKQLTWA